MPIYFCLIPQLGARVNRTCTSSWNEIKKIEFFFQLKKCIWVKPLQSLNQYMHSPSKGSQDHLKAQSFRNARGLRTHYKLKESLFLPCEKWQQFSYLKEPSLEEARHVRLSLVGCGLNYGNPSRRRQSKPNPAPFWREDRTHFQETPPV